MQHFYAVLFLLLQFKVIELISVKYEFMGAGKCASGQKVAKVFDVRLPAGS